MAGLGTEILSAAQQDFCKRPLTKVVVAAIGMSSPKAAVIEAGRWLREQRSLRSPPLSVRKVAAAASVFRHRAGEHVDIKQQQIADIETATDDRGPKKLPPWWRFVREVVESGAVDEIPSLASLREAGAQTPEYTIHDQSGAVVGRIVWETAPRR